MYITIKLLRSARFSGEQKIMVINALLDNIGALPYKKVVTYDDIGNISIAGKKLDIEQSIAFKESVVALKNNYANQVFTQQRQYMAIEMGIHQGLNQEMIMFSKACLYDIEQQKKMIDDICVIVN